MHEQTLKDLAVRVDRGRAIQKELAILESIRGEILRKVSLHVVNDRGDGYPVGGHGRLADFPASRDAISAAVTEAAVLRIASRKAELEDEFARL